MVENGGATKQRDLERFTYLDNPWSPRPVVVLEFTNLVAPESLDRFIVVEYSLSMFALFEKAIVSSALIFVCLVALILTRKLDFSVGAKDDRKKVKSL